MTRINCIPVETLNNKHLLAEYKEITRPFNKVIKRIKDNTMHKVSIPEQYCLGTGHETFFFDKLYWLSERYKALWQECLKRNFNIDVDKYSEVSYSLRSQLKDTPYWNNWYPTPEDMYLNMARICKRSNNDKVLEELCSNN